jgi:hypothetical protein
VDFEIRVFNFEIIWFPASKIKVGDVLTGMKSFGITQKIGEKLVIRNAVFPVNEAGVYLLRNEP